MFKRTPGTGHGVSCGAFGPAPLNTSLGVTSAIRTPLLTALLLLAAACSSRSASGVPGEWDFVLVTRGKAFSAHQGTVQLEGDAGRLNGQLFPNGEDT